MSITIHQKRGITKIGEYFKKLELIASDNNIDLDLLMNVYKDGLENFIDDKINTQARTKNRRHIFEKEQNKKLEHRIEE